MILLKLTANFGKLHETRTFTEGLNILCLPNEAGKSTWSAFLLAMLYGVDTSERASAQNDYLPVKERYRPWDGSPMRGEMELLWNGRHITVLRTSGKQGVMEEFRAFETQSGLPVRELTAENCGRVLCGVERSVFERTAFVRQLGLTVTKDSALDLRLGALITTGEEGRSYLELESELRKKKNRLAGRAGRLPELKAQADTLERTLTQLHALQDEALHLSASCEEARGEEARLSALVERIRRAKVARQHAGFAELKEKLAQEEAQCSRRAAELKELPPEDELRALARELERTKNEWHTAQMEAALCPPLPEPPPIPAGFSQDGDVRSDVETLRDVPSAPPVPWAGLLSAALLAVGGIAGFFFRPILALLLAAGLALGGVVLTRYLKRRTQAQRRQAQAQQIAQRYRVASAEELSQRTVDWLRATREYETKKQTVAAQRQQLFAAVEARKAAYDAVCARPFGGDEEALKAALRARADYDAQLRQLETLRSQVAQWQALLPKEEAPADEQALALDEAKLGYAHRAAQQRLSELTTRLARMQGEIRAHGDAVALEAQLEQVRAAQEDAQKKCAAIDLAADVLRQADEALRSRFSPQVTALAGKLLHRLTCGKYDRVLLAKDMRLSLRESDGIRPVAAMSCGAADQMYLALRLSMVELLLAPDVPMVLDDALVNFDDARTAAALALLRAQARQVLLFTCRPLKEEP